MFGSRVAGLKTKRAKGDKIEQLFFNPKTPNPKALNPIGCRLSTLGLRSHQAPSQLSSCLLQDPRSSNRQFGGLGLFFFWGGVLGFKV